MVFSIAGLQKLHIDIQLKSATQPKLNSSTKAGTIKITFITWGNLGEIVAAQFIKFATLYGEGKFRYTINAAAPGN